MKIVMLHFYEEIYFLTTQRHTSKKILKEEKLAPIEIQTYTLLIMVFEWVLKIESILDSPIGYCLNDDSYFIDELQ